MQCVVLGDVTAPLNPSESRLLYYMVTHRNRTLTREELYKYLYGKDYPEKEEIIKVHVCRIRRKLENLKPYASGHIRTVWGRGYCFKDTPAPYPAQKIGVRPSTD